MCRLRSYFTFLCLLGSFAALAQDPDSMVGTISASVVVAEPTLVKTVGDTVVFSPSALILEEDAVLEDILRKIPGMEVENGVVTMYGRKVEKLLVEGRLYYGGDIVTGLKNIQGDSVESIKAYVRPSDFARASGIDDGEEEPVLDVKIKQRFKGTWKGRIQGGASYPLRYMASGNAGILTDSVHVNVLANFRNLPAVNTASGLRPVKLGTGSDGDRDRREAGADFSKNGKHIELDANVKYTGSTYFRERSSSAQNFYRNSTSFVVSEETQRGTSDNIRAQADIEWKPTKQWNFILKPFFSIQETTSDNLPVSYTYKSAPWLDDEAALVNRIDQMNTSLNRRLEGRITAQATRRMAKKGRTVSLRLYEGFSTADAGSRNCYTGLTYKKYKTTVRNYLIHAPWTRNELSAQGTWNEPLGGPFHLQLILSARWVNHAIDRDYFYLSTSEKDNDFTSNGSYQGVQLGAIANFRYVKKKFNVTAGVAVKPVWSVVRYNTATEEGGLKRSSKVYAAPNISLRYNHSRDQYLSLKYISKVGMPSPTSLIPVRSGTNPLYIYEGSPDLLPSFTQKLTFTYNLSIPAKGNSLVAEITASTIKNAFSSATEYIPETGGRIIRNRNIDGTWNAGGSLVFNHSFKSIPLSISSHTDGDFTHTPTYLYNSSTKSDDINNWRRISVRERLDLSFRWKILSLTLRGGAEYTHEKSLLFEDMNYRPYSIFGEADAALRLPYRWRISTNVGLYSTRGHGFEEMDRDLCLWNASVSKSFLDGNLTLRLTANDILNQNVHLIYSCNSTHHRFVQYNGFGRMIIGQLIWRFGATK